MTLLERAQEYCGLLAAGDEIVDDTDGATIAPFRHLLPVVLFRRGLFLERTARGQIVTNRASWLRPDGQMVQRHQPITCADCKVSWFECGCGCGAGVVVQVATGYILPLQRNVGRACA